MATTKAEQRALSPLPGTAQRQRIGVAFSFFITLSFNGDVILAAFTV